MNEQTITVLLQQILEQVEQLGALTEMNQQRFATYETPLTNGAPRGDDYQRHSLLQQQVGWQQQHLREQMKRLRQRIHQLELLQRITEYTNVQVDIADVLEVGLDVVWEKTPLRFAVFILGEAELGPYTYQCLRGVPDGWRFVGKSCPFPLWGVLARALLPRLDPDEADYLIIPDIQSAKRPRAEEFPWMPLDGALMILPLRTQDRVLPTRAQERVVGAILLGSESTTGFDDPELCQDFHAIAHTLARILQIAKLRHELDDRANQLLSLQLFTRSLTAVHSFDALIENLINGIGETFGRVDVLIYLNDQLWAKEANSYAELHPYIRSIIDWTMQAGQPIFYNPDDNAESLERFYYNEAGRALVTPIIRNERTLGVIQIVALEAPRQFEEGDMIVLRTIANAIAIML
ncbi:MAG: GAF domain-containing protein [Caldilinea sp. CFX5]|nr:GAF domain-containing protein [Caldilinea sp. CFX5]